MDGVRFELCGSLLNDAGNSGNDVSVRLDGSFFTVIASRAHKNIFGGSKGCVQMEILPDELAALVFAYFEIKDLGRIARVSKSWKALTENPALRFGIDTILLRNVTIEEVSNITRGVRKCKLLDLNECTIGSTKLSNVIRELSSDLRHIRLHDCYLSDTHTNKILQAAASCPNLERLDILTTDLKLNLYNEEGLEPLLHSEQLHTLFIDGLEYSNFNIISALSDKLWSFCFHCVDSSGHRKAVYARDEHVKGICANVEGYPKLFPHPELHREKYPDGTVCHSVEYRPVRWLIKGNTYQVIQREKIYLADNEENIVEGLKDLSSETENKAKALLKTNDDVYIMLIMFKEMTLPGGLTSQGEQWEYGFKTRPPFWDDY